MAASACTTWRLRALGHPILAGPTPHDPPAHRERLTDAAARHGNPLGVLLDGNEIPQARRQPIAAELGFSETVFVEDASQGRLRLYTPASELQFAGHPLVGTAWLLGRERGQVKRLRPPAGGIPVWAEDDLLWIRGRQEWCPPWQHLRLSSVSDVERAAEAPPGHDAVQLWAFADAAAGVVRARVFAPRFGVHEDEACGSASMLLAARLGRPLTIRHGVGSEIYVRPAPDGAVDLGGGSRWSRYAMDSTGERRPVRANACRLERL